MNAPAILPDAVRKALGDLAPGRRVAVGLSGGIDSSMSAVFLKAAGFDVVGLTMQLWDGPPAPVGHSERRSACFGPGESADLSAARSVAERLGIEYHEVPLAEEYRRIILDYVREEYRRGRTPNPCVRCNARLKMEFLLQRARDCGVRFDVFATGHYARRRWDAERGRYRLFQGVDRAKDQSYFLSQLSQAQLAALVLPLGWLTKSDVRRLAAESGWEDLVRKKESQDFLDGGNYRILFADAADSKEGEVVDREGHVLGRHRGLVHYTVGQRKGLGIGGAGEPWYVVRLVPFHNRVVVGRRSEVCAKGLRAGSLHWIGRAEPPAAEWRCACRLRAAHSPAPALVRLRDVDTVDVQFDEPQFAVTPGQIAAFYDGEELVGSGVIQEAVD